MIKGIEKKIQVVRERNIYIIYNQGAFYLLISIRLFIYQLWLIFILIIYRLCYKLHILYSTFKIYCAPQVYVYGIPYTLK
jgi:hypothetical protein